MVGTKVYKTAFSGTLSSGGLLHSDWLPPNRVIAHYHKVDLISTLLDALTVQNSPRRSRRSSPPAHIENEWLPATLTLSPPAMWTHSKIRLFTPQLKCFLKRCFKTGLLGYTINYSPIIKILTLQSSIKINEIKSFYVKHRLSKTICLTRNTCLLIFFFTMYGPQEKYKGNKWKQL